MRPWATISVVCHIAGVADSLPIHWISYVDSLGKFSYGPAHANSNHRSTYICQRKWANPMEITESSYKQLNSCFVAIVSLYKVY